MRQAILVLAFLGAVLVGFVVQLFVPETPMGRALSFAAFSAALFPVARTTWFRSGAPWRYWAGLAAGTSVGFALDVWRIESGLSAEANRAIGLVVVALATGSLAVAWLRGDFKSGT